MKEHDVIEQYLFEKNTERTSIWTQAKYFLAQWSPWRPIEGTEIKLIGPMFDLESMANIESLYAKVKMLDPEEKIEGIIFNSVTRCKNKVLGLRNLYIYNHKQQVIGYFDQKYLPRPDFLLPFLDTNK